MPKQIIMVQTVDDDRRVFQLLKDAKCLGLDTETSGLNFKTDKLWSVQVSDGNIAALYPINGEAKYFPFLNRLLEMPIQKAAHNMSFDFKFLKYNGYTVNNVYCTQVAENVIEMGRVLRGHFSLKETLERNLGLELNKEVRKDFYAVYTKNPTVKNPLGVLNENYFGITKTWTDELVNYACDDVFYLPALVANQTKRAFEIGLTKTLQLEQIVVPLTAMMEYRGIRVDMGMINEFESRMTGIANGHAQKVRDALFSNWHTAVNSQYEKDAKVYAEWEAKYEEVLKTHNQKEGRKLAESAKAAREAIRAIKPKTPVLLDEFNIDSTEQVKFALAANGIDLPNLQKDNLQDYAGEHGVIDDLISYSKYNKLAEFGLIKDKVCSDGFLHPTFKQTGTDTGRYSSENPNGQNIPARTDEGKELRACFKPAEGNKFISADYAAIELVIIGILSKDERLLEALRSGKDLHLWTMSFFLNTKYELLNAVRRNEATPEELLEFHHCETELESQMDLPGLQGLTGKDWLDTFRDYIKTITYGLAYGLSSFGLSRKFKCNTQDAQKFIDIFFQVYPAIKSFLDNEGMKGFKQGYSVNINGRRRYYDIPTLPTYGSCSRELYMVYQKAYYRAKSRVMRQSANMVIQSLSADITKLAIAKIDAKLYRNNFPEMEGLVLTIHDELVLSVAAERAELAAQLLKEAMQDAAIQVLGDSVPITVVPKITDYWSK